jgi:hypothetical protein
MISKAVVTNSSQAFNTLLYIYIQDYKYIQDIYVGTASCTTEGLVMTYPHSSIHHNESFYISISAVSTTASTAAVAATVFFL